jgi:nitroreductase
VPGRRNEKEDKMEVLEAIKTRRSIRKYKTDPVDDKTIELVLEAARWAPSWGNSQCWRFIVVRDVDIKNRLADTVVSLVPGRPNHAADGIISAPVAVVACAELGKSGYNYMEPRELVTDKGEWYMFDVALAMQNLVLVAHSVGLATVHVGAFDAKKAASILQVPEGFCVVSMTPLGYPDQEPKVRPRKELSEIVFYDKYGLRQDDR